MTQLEEHCLYADIKNFVCLIILRISCSTVGAFYVSLGFAFFRKWHWILDTVSIQFTTQLLVTVLHSTGPIGHLLRSGQGGETLTGRERDLNKLTIVRDARSH